jgi:hypothetical protein
MNIAETARRNEGDIPPMEGVLVVMLRIVMEAKLHV